MVIYLTSPTSSFDFLMRSMWFSLCFITRHTQATRGYGLCSAVHEIVVAEQSITIGFVKWPAAISASVVANQGIA